MLNRIRSRALLSCTRSSLLSVSSLPSSSLRSSSFPSVPVSSFRFFSTEAQDSHSDFKPVKKTVPSTPSSSTPSPSVPLPPLPDNISTEGEMLDVIKQDVTNNPVVLYMKGSPSMPRCGFSANVSKILNHLNVSFVSRDVLSNDLLREAIKKYSDWPTLPQLYVDGEFVGGSDIVTNLLKSGELQKLLEKHMKKAL